jgi:hypothetical protein
MNCGVCSKHYFTRNFTFDYECKRAVRDFILVVIKRTAGFYNIIMNDNV